MPGSPDPDSVWLGLDLGTQGVRALGVTGAGEVLARGEAPLTSRRDGSTHEQDPQQWWAGVVTSVRQVLVQLDARRVAGVCVDATSGTVLFVDHTARDPAHPVTPALMYDDGRAGDQADRAAMAPAPGWGTAGAVPQASWGLAKALWLLERYEVPAGARLAHQADLVTSRLIGSAAATDTSHALKSGVDLEQLDWPKNTLERLGLSAERLPPVVLPGTVIGEVGPAAADQIGLPAGVPVVAGLTDGCASQVASGALSPGAWNFVVGTTLVLKGTTPDPVHDPTGAVYSHRSPDGGWWPGGASSAGAGVLAEEFPERDLAALDEAAAEREPARCVTYPLVGGGERFPFKRSDAVRFTVGEPRDEVDRYAAILQGVAFVERLCLDHLAFLGAPVSDVVSLTGGATRSRYWNQLQADILERVVTVPEVAEAGLGAAIVAASRAYGGIRPAAEAMVRIRERVEPRPGAPERFHDGYARLVHALSERGWFGG